MRAKRNSTRKKFIHDRCHFFSLVFRFSWGEDRSVIAIRNHARHLLIILFIYLYIQRRIHDHLRTFFLPFHTFFHLPFVFFSLIIFLSFLLQKITHRSRDENIHVLLCLSRFFLRVGVNRHDTSRTRLESW